MTDPGQGTASRGRRRQRPGKVRTTGTQNPRPGSNPASGRLVTAGPGEGLWTPH